MLLARADEVIEEANSLASKCRLLEKAVAAAM
jgi:hypothetical protein